MESLKERDIHVGAKAILAWPGSRQEVEIIEDLGNLGQGGRRLVRVRSSPWPPMEFDIPADMLLPPDTPHPAMPRRRGGHPTGPR